MSTILIEGEPCVACGTQNYEQSGDVIEQLHDLDGRPWCVPCARTVLAESGSKEEPNALARAERAEAGLRACMAVLQRFASDDMDATPLPEEVDDALEFGKAALEAASRPAAGGEP